MSDDAGLSYSSLLGAMSVTTVANQILLRAQPILESTLGIDTNVLLTICIFLAMLFVAWERVDDFVRTTLLEDHYTCNIQVSSEDSIYTMLMEYLDEHRIFGGDVGGGDPGNDETSDIELIGRTRKIAWYAKPTRNLEANLDGWRIDFFKEELELDDDDDEAGVGDETQRSLCKNRRKIKYAPSPGYCHYFYYKPTGHTVKVTRTEPQDPSSGAWWKRKREHITLSIYGRDDTPLKTLLRGVLDRRNRRDLGRTAVFKATQGMGGDGPTWECCSSRPIRPIHTVILDDAQKEMICSDIAEYLMPATAKWYNNRGLPYRRGYLLYGPPGTGKTSLTVALAGKYGLQVHSLSLSASWMNDDILVHLFSRLPRSCIVLLEDVDACGVTREGDRASATTVAATTPSKPDDAASADAKAKVTFSGLLNAIDGVASKDGRLLIMTTNHRSRLDEALIRPGRVDIQVRFDYADAVIVHDLFSSLYDVSDEDKTLLKFPADFPAADELAQLARTFVDRVPSGRFSPAEVQGFLLRFKKHPRLAVAAVRDWVVKCEIEKQEKERRESLRQQHEKLDDTQQKLAAVKELLEKGVITQGAVVKSLAADTDTATDTTVATANAGGEGENPAAVAHSLQNGSATDTEPKKPLANGVKGAKPADATTLTNGSSTAK